MVSHVAGTFVFGLGFEYVHVVLYFFHAVSHVITWYVFLFLLFCL